MARINKNKRMKNIVIFILMVGCVCNVIAQNPSLKKPPVIGLHFFYNDFVTPGLIKTTSIGNVVKNKQWNKPQNMEGGFGIDYLQGLTTKLDAVATINANWVNYLLPGSSLYGSSNFLLDINAGTHIKLWADEKVFNPFLITKIGYSSYKNINGFSLLPGAGFQVNLFDEAFIITTFEYRCALNKKISNQLYYSIGIATGLFKRKVKALPLVQQPFSTSDSVPVITEIKKSIKDIAVTVLDEATGQPLQFAEVSIKNKAGNIYTATSNADGKAIFNAIAADSFYISGRLNKIDAVGVNIGNADFNIPENQLTITITHNDARFTLAGYSIDKKANTAVSGALITITNSTQNSTSFATSDELNGEFRSQLEKESEFTIVGKKASYISNIENISTRGLNRSTTLYVKLTLGIQEAKAGTNLVLNKIFFETGKASLNTAASGDLDKLIQFLKDNPQTKLEIQGHTDNTGSVTANSKLSQMRANSVVDYLIKQGIDNERLIAKGYGPSLPIADNNTTAGKAQNRRVEMKVLE
jgi:outer membrane protein OmpA-like peptidoglycan-associated protein